MVLAEVSTPPVTTFFADVSTFFTTDFAESSICSEKDFTPISAFFATLPDESNAATGTSELFNILSAPSAPNIKAPPSPTADDASTDADFPSFNNLLKPLASPIEDATAPIAA